jgi:C1A family cysteine protease
MSKSSVRWVLVSFLLVGGSAGSACDEDSGQDPDPVDDGMYPLSDPSALRSGAPGNDDLPAEGKADEVLPRRYDLVMTQSPVRNQGSRGVCSIFGTIALMEHLYIVEGTLASPDFSEQFLQWSTKFEMGQF